MKKKKQSKIMNDANTYWSDEEHLNQCIEEAGEVIVAAQNLKRSHIFFVDFLEELIDVEIMIDHYRSLHPISMKSIKAKKMRKMKRLMKEGKR